MTTVADGFTGWRREKDGFAQKLALADPGSAGGSPTVGVQSGHAVSVKFLERASRLEFGSGAQASSGRATRAPSRPVLNGTDFLSKAEKDDP
jgi:hypothetical protein